MSDKLYCIQRMRHSFALVTLSCIMIGTGFAHDEQYQLMQLSSDKVKRKLQSCGSRWKRCSPLGVRIASILGRVLPPPPPRPAHLQGAAPDGLTTCDLCAWARAESSHTPIDSGGIGWVMTLVIVSFISAALGAVIMMTIIRCRRQIQSNGGIAGNGLPSSGIGNTVALSDGSIRISDARASQRVKTSLTPPTITENHYTHMEGAATGLSEGQYASIGRQMGVYTNSAPSSAYYSELSAGDRAYESVDIAPSFSPSQATPIVPASDYV